MMQQFWQQQCIGDCSGVAICVHIDVIIIVGVVFVVFMSIFESFYSNTMYTLFTETAAYARCKIAKYIHDEAIEYCIQM